MKIKMSLLFFIIVLAGLDTCLAQQATQPAAIYDFMPREHVIFEDDFSQDAVGAFPSKWHRFGEGASRSPEHCQIAQDGDVHVLVTSDITSDIEPDMKNIAYVPDSFTIELDFMLSNTTTTNLIAIDFRDSDHFLEHHEMVTVRAAGDVNYAKFTPDKKESKNCKYPGKFIQGNWHHLAITANEKHFDVYIDKFSLLSVQGKRNGYPSFGMHCVPPGSVKNIRLATGRQISTFNKLLTEKKFVTNTIHFDVAKSVIKEESMGYVMQLAQFLKANPSIRLEIDGHTDNVGDAKSNMLLSQSRADEVKQQLVSAGIENSRLVAKGFGDTKPLQSNNTPKGRMENRRVEFVKL